MDFKLFSEKIVALANKAGLSVRVFKRDDGKHQAVFSDGTVIIGNSVSKKLCVKWGSGHTAMATV